MLNYIVLGFPTNTTGQGNIGKKEVKLRLPMSLLPMQKILRDLQKTKILIFVAKF